MKDNNLWHYESGVIVCDYSSNNIKPMCKKDIDAIAAFKKIVLNYLKMKRIDKMVFKW